MQIPKRSSVMIKLIAAFFAAMMPVTLLYISTYHQSRTLLMEEALASIQRQNDSFSDRLGDDMQRILSTNRLLSHNWELGKLAVVPDEFSPFEKSVAISNVQDKIYLAQITSRFLESIEVYIPAIDKCISTNQSSGSLADMRRLTEEIGRIPQDRFIIRNGKLVLIAQNTFNPDDGPAVVIQTVLSPNNINDMLRQSSQEDITRGLLFSLHDSTLLSNQSSEDEGVRDIVLAVSNELHRAGSKPSGIIDVATDGARYKANYSYLQYGDVVLVRYFDQRDLQVGFHNMRMLMLLFVILFSAAFLLLFLSLNRIVNTPLRRLLRAFEQVMAGDLNVSIKVRNQSEFKTIYEGFNRMVARIRELINQNYQQTIYLQQAELKQLQAQIDPHFLYNSFFILNKRIRAGDTPGALSFSYSLSEYFQYVTHNARDRMRLVDEVKHAYNYARIQQIRFSNRLLLHLQEVPAEWQSAMVPRLIIQPVFENVFRHVLEKEHTPLALRVRYEPLGTSLLIHVEDSGSMLSDDVLRALSNKLDQDSREREVSGLVNVHRRLLICYGEGYGVALGRSILNGLHVILKIKLEDEYHDEESSGS